MKKTFISQAGFSGRRVLIGLLICLGGAFLALAGLGQSENSKSSTLAPVAHVTWAAEPFSNRSGDHPGPTDEGDLAVVAPTRSTFMARWDRIPGALSYQLDVSTSDSFGSFVTGYQDLDVGNVTGRVVTGLSKGVTYYYRVRARFVSGVGADSGARTATTVPTGGLTINPTFDTSITGDPNAVAIEGMINQAIAIYESSFNDPVTISILFRYTTDADPCGPLPANFLGRSCTCLSAHSWNEYVNALIADAHTANDTTANASLPGSPLSTNVVISTANGRAVGLNTPGGQCGIGPYDGTLTLNSDAPLQFTRPPSGGNYDARRTTEHEIDEIMGLGALTAVLVNNCGTNNLRPQDLFSWSSAGNRNLCTTGTRYFSINSGSTNIVNFNQTAGGDFGDWISPACPQPNPYVQNAFSCSGQFSDVTATSPEGINLDVIGYDFGSAPTPRTLTVASANPSSGVGITVNPNDNNGQGNGTTQFTRVYNNNQNVSLTAPSTAGGNNFQKWQRDGLDWSTSTSTTVTLDANHTMTAVYVTPPPPTRTLTVASTNPNSGVGVTVSPNDNNGQGSGTTQFTRVYSINQSVSLTAPSTAGGNNFQKWQRDGVDWSSSTSTSLTMDASHTMTALYGVSATPTPGCATSITQSSTQTITLDNSVSCNNGTGHTDNSYWRAFNMGTFVGSNQYNVTSVSFGVERATGAGGTQPVTVRLYTNTGGAFPGGTRSQIAASSVNVPDSASGTVFTVPLTATVPAGAELVMEVFTPDGTVAGNLLFIGSNAGSESGPSYLSAANCGFATPTTTAAVGFPDMHIVFNVNGSCGGGPPPPSPTPAILGNISTRLRVETGNNVLIGGFIVTGTQPKRVIVRAIGPSLASLFTGVLPDPVLELHGPAGFPTITNDDWRDTQEAEILATGIAPTNNLESAIVATLPANNSAYTAIVRGFNNVTGIGIVEAYDLDQTVNSRLGNISTRGLVQTDNNVMIGGLIVLGQAPLRVLLRAIGPSLTIAGALGDPTLELRDGNGALIAFDDDWRTGGQEAEIIGTGIPPSDDLESAIVRNLTPGNYTAIVRGFNNATGVGLVEAYGLQ